VHVLNLIRYGRIARLSQLGGEEGVNFLIQVISTCLHSRKGRGDGGRHPVVAPLRKAWQMHSQNY
jgi:hypothetical protein